MDTNELKDWATSKVDAAASCYGDEILALLARLAQLEARTVKPLNEAEARLLPMAVHGTTIRFPYGGGFDVRNCDDPHTLIQMIAASCNARLRAAPAQPVPEKENK